MSTIYIYYRLYIILHNTLLLPQNVVTYISSYFYITEVTQREISAAPAPVVVVDPPILAAGV